MRYERKYKIERLSLPLVHQSIRLHPASFRKIFPDRQVNNIYFDTSDFRTYKDNVMGIAQRRKFRIRWYGENMDTVLEPRFEIKIKNNQLGDKTVEQLESFDLTNLDFITKQIQPLANTFNPLKPTLLNSYHRSYYGTPDKKFRITIDSKMRYFSLINNKKLNTYQLEDEEIVMELKYEEALDSNTDRITQHLPYRLSKSSKYVTGMGLTL